MVTGSGRNLGRATVLKLAAEGAHVAVNARSNQAEADAVAREARARGVKALSVIGDVATADEVEAMVAKALSEFGRIDILINNAATRPGEPFTKLTLQGWENTGARNGPPSRRARRAPAKPRRIAGARLSNP